MSLDLYTVDGTVTKH